LTSVIEPRDYSRVPWPKNGWRRVLGLYNEVDPARAVSGKEARLCLNTKSASKLSLQILAYIDSSVRSRTEVPSPHVQKWQRNFTTPLINSIGPNVKESRNFSAKEAFMAVSIRRQE